MTKDFTQHRVGRLTLVHSDEESSALLSAALEKVFTRQDSILATIDGCHYSLEAGVFHVVLADLQQELVFVVDELRVSEDDDLPEKSPAGGVLLYLFPIPANAQIQGDRSTWRLDTCLDWLQSTGKPFILLLLQAQNVLPGELTPETWPAIQENILNGMKAGGLVPGAWPSLSPGPAAADLLLDSYCRIINRHFTGHEEEIAQKIAWLYQDPVTKAIGFGLDALILRLLLSMLQRTPADRYTVLDTSTKNVYAYV